MGKFVPRPDQRADLDTLKEAGYVAMLDIQQGGGKTLLSTFALQESGAQVALIVAPLEPQESAWKPTVLDVLGVEAREIGGTGAAKKEALADFELGTPGVYLCSPQYLARADVSTWSGDMLVIDEAHQVSNPGKKAQVAIGGFKAEEQKKALVNRFPMRLTLSGTSLRNRFELAWSYGRFLWPEYSQRGELAYFNFWGWRGDRMTSRTIYTDKKDKKGNTKTAQVFDAEKEPGRWISECPTVIRHRKREECCEFHPNGFLPLEEPTVIHETIPLATEQKKAIHELEEHMMTFLEENPLIVEIPLTKTQRIRQCILGVPTIEFGNDGEEKVTFADDCKSPFLDRAIELLENDLEDETAILWTDSQKFASVATKRLNDRGISAFEYSGATRKTRNENKNEFGKKFRVVVAVISALGTGADGLQKVCNNEIYLSRDMDETNSGQSEDRLDRPGQTKQVMRWVFHDDKGISEGRYSKQIEKRLQLNRSLQRGVANG